MQAPKLVAGYTNPINSLHRRGACNVARKNDVDGEIVALDARGAPISRCH